MDLTLSQFYKDKCVLVTGGTGFVGTALIEKLLNSFPDIGSIFLLLRTKRGKSIDERFSDFKNQAVFKNLTDKRGENIWDKVVPISGDVESDGLGLSERDELLIRSRTNIIFHCAATLDFFATLKHCVDVNLLGTMRVLKLAESLPLLEVFLFVSSAYANCFKTGRVGEIMHECSGMKNEAILEKVSSTATGLEKPENIQMIIGNHKNPYTYTKHAAEIEVSNANLSRASKIIVRPSMITTAWQHPTPGWTISKNGPTGFIMGASLGVVRRVPINRDLIYDYIPIDVVVNTMITSAWYEYIKSGLFKIYHCTTSQVNPFRWREVDDHVNDILHKYPATSAVLYPYLKFMPSLERFYLSSLIFHILPGAFLDLAALCTGRKARLLKIHWNVLTSLTRLSPFIFNEWVFESNNYKLLKESLRVSGQENVGGQESFPVDVTSLDWTDYMEHMVVGVRENLLKDRLDSLPKAKKIDTKLFYIQYAYIFGLLGFMLLVGQLLGLNPSFILYFILVYFIAYSFF